MLSTRDEKIHAALTDWLASPNAYSPIPNSVERVETHISQVFLAGECVYKLKKPVKYAFLDFSTLAAREHACREEVRLNRRLAPEVYLGVVSVAIKADETFCLAGPGEVVDWLVQMRRLPSHRMLDVLHHRGELRTHDIDRLVERLVRFYTSLPPAELDAETYRLRFRSYICGNRDELLASSHPLPRPMVQRAHSFQLQLLLLGSDRFDQRVEAGCIVDGHGDLRPEHICFTDPIAIFDCIEFNPEYRQLDVADELAFLATECDYLGATWVGTQLLNRFYELCGNRPSPILLDFYKAYRASVRAKISTLRAAQLSGPAGEQAATEAVAHLRLANVYAALYLRPLVVVVGGLSGTGKSTLARLLTREISAELLSSDVVRRELFGQPADQPAVDSERYHPQSRALVYQEMFRRAADLHGQRVSVVLDATFSRAADVSAAQALANDSRAIFLAIECHCPPGIARQRIESRQLEGTDASDACPEIYEMQRIRREDWPDSISQLRVDTTLSLTNQLQRVISELSRRWSE